MGIAMRISANSLTVKSSKQAEHVHAALDLWQDATWKYDYFAVMRRLETASYPLPRWGCAALPTAEALRIGQEPSLAFAPAALSRIECATDHAVPRLRQQFIGYIGPNGPLPVHLSDFILERARNHGDKTWIAFLDGFTHRFALHFYRAWAQAQPAVGLDRPAEDGFRRYVGAFAGAGTIDRQNRDSIYDDARLHFSGWLVRQVRSAESVETVISRYFDVPVRLQQWVGHWIRLSSSDTTHLGDGKKACALGEGAVLGSRVWDRQHKVRVHLGPLVFSRYREFLPGGSARVVLQRWIQQLLGDEYDWDAQLVLTASEVPVTRLGGASHLGWSSWLGERSRSQHAADVLIAN